jgi:hypothetical protein
MIAAAAANAASPIPNAQIEIPQSAPQAGAVSQGAAQGALQAASGFAQGSQVFSVVVAGGSAGSSHSCPQGAHVFIGGLQAGVPQGVLTGEL